MVQVIQAQNITLAYLKEKFGLQLSDEEHFFPEWREELPEISNWDSQYLDRVKTNYLSLVNRQTLSENMVKMVVVSPLLDLTGFYRLPFDVKDEKSIDISVPDEDAIVRGRLDFLIFNNLFWLIVVESKNAGISVREAIPQTLAYMLANPLPEKAIFGLFTNGDDFVFLKLTQQTSPCYALSDKFTLLKQENELYNVLRIMKKLSQIIQ